MILASEKATKEIGQSEPDPKFTVRAPSVNPLAAGSTFSVTEGSNGVAVDSLEERVFPKETSKDTFGSRMIARSKREVERRPHSARAHTNLGIAMLNAGEIASARNELEVALKIDKAHYVAATTLGRIEVEAGNFDRAISIYEELRRRYPQNATPVVSLAHIAMKRQDWKTAEALLRESIDLGHRALTARYNLATVQLKLGKSREAIALFRSVARDEVRAPSIYEGLGAAYALNGDLHRAEVSFRTALSLDPSSHSAIQGLANVLVGQESWDELNALLIGYLEKNPSDLTAREVLARAYTERGQHRSAIAQLTHIFTELERFNSQDTHLEARIANNIGAAFLKDGDKSQARNWLIKSIEIASDYIAIPYQNLARVSMQLEEYNEALAILETCRKRFPNDETTILLISSCLTNLGLYDDALAQCQSFAASGKAGPALYADLGRLLCEIKEDYDSALAVLQEGYEKFQDNASLVNNLAYAHLMVGDAKVARSLLESIDREDNSNKDISTRVALTATWGLLYMTEGEIGVGEHFYKEGQALASMAGNKKLARVVLQKRHLELARALHRKGDRATAQEQVRQGLAIRDASEFYDRDLRVLDKILSAV